MNNPYELIMKIQRRMQSDPNFARKFNALVQTLNNIPGLQQEVIRIAQIRDDKQRQNAIDKLPSQVKDTVKELMRLMNS